MWRESGGAKLFFANMVKPVKKHGSKNVPFACTRIKKEMIDKSLMPAGSKSSKCLCDYLSLYVALLTATAQQSTV